MPIVPKEHVVKAGDCIASIAFANGFFPETLWNDAGNDPLRAAKRDPYVLMPGDVVHIPDKRLGELEATTGQTNTFVLKGVPEKFRLQLMLHGKPRVDLAVEVVVAGKTIPLTTDGDGRIECWIPPDAATARLIVSKDEEYTLALGHVNPVSDDKGGALVRLVNLGYLKSKDAEPEVVKRALERFQLDHDLLPVTGKLDDATREKLKEKYNL